MLKSVKPAKGMEIRESVRFLPGEYDFREGDGPVIVGDDIVVDGGGAVLSGGCTPEGSGAETNKEEFGYGESASPDNGRRLGFCGTGLRISGRARVTVMNLTLKGFDIGALIENCQEITLIGCDLSGCFHDPAWGWDEHGDHGAILMLSSERCRIINCRANHVWDALNMRWCNDCLVCGCDFSHTSDTGLKLWNSCRNRIVDCDFSYGIRIDPGEVHARDSSGVLIESGSDHNWFSGNDMSHGGDGLFIRVLNGWMSCHNVFIGNDCSYANNNAIEAWSDHNTYIGNKASYSSYGFWLGNSDYIVMEDNEIAFNGWSEWHNNAPEAFGNAGVAIVNGSGSHSIIRGNHIHDNCGPGIAIRNTLENPSRHWLIAGNRIENNRNAGKYCGHGIYLRHARLVALEGNAFTGNEGQEICRDGDVSDVYTLAGGESGERPELTIRLLNGGAVCAGQPVRFEANGSADWDFGDDCTAHGDVVEHIYEKAGLYPVSATAIVNGCAALAGMTVQAFPEGFRPIAVTGECADAAVENTHGGVRVSAREGAEHVLILRPSEKVDMDDSDALAVHIAYFSDAPVDWDKKTRYPKLKLYGIQGGSVELVPTEPLLEMLYAPRNEMRGEGRIFIWPMKGCKEMNARMIDGGLRGGLDRIELTYGGIGDAHSTFIIHSIGLCKADAPAQRLADLAVEAVYEYEGNLILGSLNELAGADRPLSGDQTARVAFEGAGALGVRFPVERTVNRVDCVFYENRTGTDDAHGETLPENCVVEVLTEAGWNRADCRNVTIMANVPTVFVFEPVVCLGVRVRFDENACIAGMSVYNTRCADARIIAQARMQQMDALEIKLNKELNGNGSLLGNLTARVFALNSDGKLTDCLFETEIPEEEIVPYVPLSVPTPGLELREGVRYALALGQTNRAKSRTEGDYYRWIGGQTGCDEVFAIYNGTETCPSDYDWGTAWLRARAGEAMTDLTHSSEHVGTRFGIEDMECRYQTFRAPEQYSLLADGRAAGGGYRLNGEIVFELSEKQRIEAVDLYLAKAFEGEIRMFHEDGTVLAAVVNPDKGRVRLSVGNAEVKRLRLFADGDAMLTEVEIIKA